MALIESAGAVLYTEDGGVRQYVLVMEKNGSFGLPKGHVEPGETLARRRCARFGRKRASARFCTRCSR